MWYAWRTLETVEKINAVLASSEELAASSYWSIHGSHSQRRRRKAWPSRRHCEGRGRIWPQFPAASQARHRSQQGEQGSDRPDEGLCRTQVSKGKNRG